MTVNEYASREVEVQEAIRTNPGMEMGEAYRRWKEARGETATMLTTAMDLPSKEDLNHHLDLPCTKEGCGGIMVLEGVCGGCVEGRAGYKSKWTCPKCLHRELSKKGLYEWARELSGSSSKE